MATTKEVTVLFNTETLTAGAGDETSALATLDDGYGAALNVKITNGVAGPTLPAQVQIEVSSDNVEWYEFGSPVVGSVENDAVESWGGIAIPVGVEYLRLLAGSNTGQDVVIEVDISEVTAI
jgi:hypothetical protein